MRKTYKSLSALFLVLCMVLTWMVPAAFAEESQTEEWTPLVESVVVAEDVIQSVEAHRAATAVVNGHDYMYLFFNGKTLLVYDLDTGELVDKEKTSHGTTRSIYIDPDGIVWAGGAGGQIYRYNPYEKVGEMILIPGDVFPVDSSYNTLGMTGDENGIIYFGTYNRGYVGMYNPKTGEFTNLSGEMLHDDAMYSGWGGVILKDGYLYLSARGDKNKDSTTTHELIKFDLDKREIVQRLDITPIMKTSSMDYLSLVGDVLFGSRARKMNGTIAVDVSGEEMKLIEIEGLPNSFNGAVSNVMNGKAYMMSVTGQGLLEYDVATRTATETGIAVGTLDGADSGELQCRGGIGTGGWVTIDGLPGQTLVTFKSPAGMDVVDLVFYNIETKQTIVMEDYTKGVGSGNQMIAISASQDGKKMYLGAYENHQLGVYDIESGVVVDLIYTHSGQVESVLEYDGYVYVGNYSSATMTQVDLETKTARPLFELNNTAFFQNRAQELTAGDGKVFLATTAGKARHGGCLTWYDMAKDRVYVAAGPNAEDVYYTSAVLQSPYTWYNAATNEVADFDDNNDGKEDNMITVDGKSVQRFKGVIENQTINCMVYKDGYIYASSSKHGGSGSSLEDYDDCAVIFVYDVEAMEVVATYEVCKTIEGLTEPVEFVEGITEDPEVDGKFWGVVSDTLFSFTFNHETKTFQVTEEVSLGKEAYRKANGWCGREIVFEGDFMYVIFPSNGLYLVEKANTENYYKLTDIEVAPKHIAMGADGNLYYTDYLTDLMMLPVDEVTDNIVAANAARAQIDAIGTVTLESEAAIQAARAAYDALTEDQKALVTNLNVLKAAEDAYTELIKDPTNPDTGDSMPAVLLTYMLIASTAVLTSLVICSIRKKYV